MFLWMMVPALIASLAAYFFIPKQVTQTVIDEEPAPETKPPYVNILKKPSLWLFSLAAICWNIPYWGFLGWMPSYLSLARDIDLKTMGMVASIPYIFAFFGILLFCRRGRIRSEEHRLGQECVSMCRSQWSTDPENKKKQSG